MGPRRKRRGHACLRAEMRRLRACLRYVVRVNRISEAFFLCAGLPRRSTSAAMWIDGSEPRVRGSSNVARQVGRARLRVRARPGHERATADVASARFPGKIEPGRARTTPHALGHNLKTSSQKAHMSKSSFASEFGLLWIPAGFIFIFLFVVALFTTVHDTPSPQHLPTATYQVIAH
jgi:hypothetical protein